MKSEKFKKLSKKLSDLSGGKLNETSVQYLLGAFAIIVLLIVVIIILSVKSCQGENNTESKETTSTVVSGETNTAESDTAESTIRTVEDTPLEENAYQEINDLVAAYFTAMAQGDMDTVTTLETPMTEMKQLTIEAKSQYIESFENIAVYTKPGPKEDTFIVFVYNEVKFYNVNTTAAAVNTLYACRNEEGNYYFYGGEIDEEEEAYINEIIEQDDVTDLFNKADVKFQEAIDADSELATMLNSLPDQLKESVGEAVASLNTEESTQETTAEEGTLNQEDENAASAGTETEEKAVAYETVKPTSTVNVRASASEESDRIGQVTPDMSLKRTETLENGWSAIEYQDGTGYVKSEYLSVSSITYEDGTVSNLSGLATPTTTINVRASASENADRIGVAVQGQELKVLEVLENGWTKVEYEGREAFVKTEYLSY